MSNLWEKPAENKKEENEHKKESPQTENQEKKEPHEQEKNTAKYGSAKKYLGKWIDNLKIHIVREKIQGKNEDAEDAEQAVDDLSEKLYGLDRDIGGSTVELLERIYPLSVHNDEKKDLEEWRKTIFETSNEFFTKNRFMKPENMAEFFDNEYHSRIDEMDGYNNKYKDLKDNEKSKWSHDANKWGDVSNELLYGNHKNALVLIEEDIRHTAEIIEGNRTALKEIGKSKNKNVDHERDVRETISKYSEKLGKMRNVRDSLYAIEFKK